MSDWIALETQAMRNTTHFAVNIPDCANTEWRIESFTLTKEAIGLQNLRAIRDGNPELIVSPGKYKRLVKLPNGPLMMTNTQMEYRTSRAFLGVARGHVLVTGLGLGAILKPISEKPEVESVTVLEISQSLVDLVWEKARVPKSRIIVADAYAWKPDRSFDCAWHDIWPDISADNLSLMTKLKRHYVRQVPAGQQHCWSEWLARRDKRRYG